MDEYGIVHLVSKVAVCYINTYPVVNSELQEEGKTGIRLADTVSHAKSASAVLRMACL